MKFSKETMVLLQNFANINPNIWVNPGKDILTANSPTRTVYAKASVAEEFEVSFGLYDLGKFLTVLKLFQEPDLEFGERFVTVSSGKTKIRYYYAAKSTLALPPDKQFKFPAADIEFELTEQQLSTAVKAASALSVSDISFEGKDGTNAIVVQDLKIQQQSDGSDDYRLELGETELSYRMDFNVATLLLLPGDYKVAISSKNRIVEFSHKTLNVTYYLGAALTSVAAS